MLGIYLHDLHSIQFVKSLKDLIVGLTITTTTTNDRLSNLM